MQARVRSALSTFALVVLVALLAVSACDESGTVVEEVVACDAAGTAEPVEAFLAADLAVHLDGGGDPGLEIVRQDVGRYLGRLWGLPDLAVTRGPPDFTKRVTVWLSTSEAARARAGVTLSDGYTLQRLDSAAGALVIVYAPDSRNLAYGAYALLEELGARFFHPKDELVPTFAGPRLPRRLAVTRAPMARSRGLQLHTLHPIEYFKVLNEPGPENLADAKRLVDWLVKTGQNYLQWVELSTVPFDAWKPHAQAIVDYAHLRGVSVGACVQVWGGASLQNNYVLVTDAASWQTEMDAQLDRLLEVRWDTVELALGEFSGTDPQTVIDWLNHAVAHALARSPALEVDVQNHVGNYPSLWVTYRGQTVYYYHLPQFADPRLGQAVHTLFFFDLYRDWATYAHPNFHLQHDYLMKELPSRRVKYFPESAYWISADIDVPLFLPEYLQARWLDIHGLNDEIRKRGLPPLEGHLTFSSGHEWNYWLTDYLTAKMLWEPEQPLSYFVAHYAAAYGSCGGDIAGALSSFIDLQSKFLFDQRLVSYLQGENSTVDFGYLVGLETHPKRVAFEEVLAMSGGDRAAFGATVVAPLEAFASAIQPLEDAVAARCRGSGSEAAPWCNELWDGMAIVRLRAEHAAHLYRSVLAKALGGDGSDDYLAALDVTGEARAVIARREAHYRFDLSREVDAYSNPTVYGFGYLRPAHTACYWVRREQQVRTLLDTGFPAGIIALPTCSD